jgi:hypothetical protein
MPKQETDEQRDRRLAYSRAYKESPEQKERRRERDRIRQSRKRSLMTTEEKRKHAAWQSEYQKKRRALQSPEERSAHRRRVYHKYKSDAYRAVSADYMRRRRRQNPSAAIAERLRARIKAATRAGGAAKASGIGATTGCSSAELSQWIEKQFLPGMTWDNRSEWHIDHIIPCSAFNMTDVSQQQVAFHFTNLRPLWARDNLLKRGKVPAYQLRFLWTLCDIALARKRLGLLASPSVQRLDRSAMT